MFRSSLRASSALTRHCSQRCRRRVHEERDSSERRMSNLVLLSCWFVVEPAGRPVLKRFFIFRVPLNYRRSSGMVK